MSHSELLVESISLNQVLIDNLVEAEKAAKGLRKQADSLQKDNDTLKKEAKELREELENNVQLVKVAGAESIPMEKIASVVNTLVTQGFLEKNKQQEFEQALSDQGAPALLDTLQKVASTAIIPHTMKEEGSLVMDKAASSAESNKELLSPDQQVWADSFKISVVKE